MAKGRRPLALAWILGLVGCAVGAFAGYAGFDYAASHDWYVQAFPGALVGFLCGLLSGRRVWTLGLVAAAVGLLVGVLTEWRYSRGWPDTGLWDFLATWRELPDGNLLRVAVGTLLAFWLGSGRNPKPDAIRDAA